MDFSHYASLLFIYLFLGSYTRSKVRNLFIDTQQKTWRHMLAFGPISLSTQTYTLNWHLGLKS
jgi:hypothetical protein